MTKSIGAIVIMRAAVVAALLVIGGMAVWLFRPGAHMASTMPSPSATAQQITTAATGSIEIVLDPAGDNGRTIAVEAPSQLSLYLDAVPSTGHRWEIDGDLPSHMRLLGSAFLDKEPAMPGATKRQHLRFEVLSQGRAEITLVYRQPWNRSDPGLKRLSVVILAK